MTTPSPTAFRSCGAVILSVALLGTLVCAQTTDNTGPRPAEKKTATTASTSADPDEPLVLSPFQVSANSDVGYQATDTLAGTRIRTDLSDVGTSISVATKEFMNDIGATDSQTLLQFMAGTEVGGAKGNFLVGSSVGDASTLDETNALLRPQGNTRVRGLTSADNTRDYFLTDIPWDGYNTPRVDILRGPNSIMFGNGSGAGIVNGGIDAASLARSSTSLEYKTDKYGSNRFSLNSNQVLLKNELAIRVAGLKDHKYYQQDPAYNDDQRGFIAVKYEPHFLKFDGARTSIRASYENGRINANRPRMTTINDGISPWFLKTPVEFRSPYPLGRPAGMDNTLLGVMYPMVNHDGYDPFVTNISGTALSTLLAANPTRTDIGARQPISSANKNAEGWLGAVVVPTDSGASQTGNGIDNGGLSYWVAEYDAANSSALSRYFYPSLNTNNAINSSGVRDAQPINGLRGPDLTGILRLDQYSVRGVGSFQYTLQGVWRSLTIHDPSFFDFYKKLIDGPNKAERSKFDAFNAALEQSFFHDQVGFQLAFDEQTYADYRRSNLGNPTIRIDPYKYLPVAVLNSNTGVYEPVVNPNFGRPFIVSKPSASRSRTRRDVTRFTPYATLDFQKVLQSRNLLTRILGKHTFTGLYEMTEVKRKSSGWVPYTLDADLANQLFFNGGTVSGTLRSVGTVTYLGPSLATATTMSGANISGITAVQQPGLNGSNNAANAWYFDSRYVSATAPNASFTPPAIGLAPNQVGGNATTQSENPINYAGWGSSPRQINVLNDTTYGERNLTTSFQQSKTRTTSQAIVDQWALLNRSVIVTGGLRRDKVDTFYPGDPAWSATDTRRTGSRIVDNTTGVVDWSQPFAYTNAASASYTSDWMKTYGIVLHAPQFITKRLPWGLRPSVFYSHSENFQPVTRKNPISGADLTPPVATTREVGFGISSANRKFSLKVNWYQTNVRNASMPDNGVISFGFDEIYRGTQFSKLVLYATDINNGTNLSGSNPDHITGTPPSGPNGNPFYRPTANSSGSSTNLDPTGTHWYPWQPSRALAAGESWTLQEWKDAEDHAVASANAFLNSLKDPRAQSIMALWAFNPNAWNFTANTEYGLSSSRPQSLAITGDAYSKGNEIELFISPMSGWDITMNVAKTFATRRNLAGDMSQWLQDRWALYNEHYIGADGAIVDPSTGKTVYTGLLAGGVRWFGGGQGNVNAGQARFGRNGYRYYSEFASKEGTTVPDMRPWRFNLVTNYRFQHGMLKGAFVGASYRWEDRSIIGYGVTETYPEQFVGTTSVVDAVGILDAMKPYYSPSEDHYGAFVGYSRKVWKRVTWRVQLNVNNIGEKNHLIPVTVEPDGTPAAYRIAEGAGWELRNTFQF